MYENFSFLFSVLSTYLRNPHSQNVCLPDHLFCSFLSLPPLQHISCYMNKTRDNLDNLVNYSCIVSWAKYFLLAMLIHVAWGSFADKVIGKPFIKKCTPKLNVVVTSSVSPGVLCCCQLL